MMNMRKSIVATAIVLTGLTATTAWAQQASRDFTLRNRTSYTITGFWFSTPKSNQWTAMQGNTIAPNQSATVHFDHSGPCELQFRVQTTAGTADFMRPFDFCALRTVSIYYDADDKVFTATER